MGWGLRWVGGVEQWVAILRECPVRWIQFVGVKGVEISDEASLSNLVCSGIQS
jgi:hypothetical protein